jgi:hypothetical protein
VTVDVRGEWMHMILVKPWTRAVKQVTCYITRQIIIIDTEKSNFLALAACVTLRIAASFM